MGKNVDDQNEQGKSSGKKAGNGKQPVLSINLYSWTIPLVGLVMLVIGLMGGYLLRPLVPSEPRPSSVVESAGSTGQAAAPSSPGVAQAPSQDALQVMEALTSETKHFIGDADAPVVMIEFSDFQ